MIITEEINERLTQVGPGTPMGETFRRYWNPALLSEEVPHPDSPPVRVRLLGEDLVCFRDSSGQIGLVEAFCAHRRAPLFFGRNEECGLRCVYHGWKFDTSGNCVDMPSEPPYSKFKLRVAIKAYSTHEAGGIIWAYMGPIAEEPPFPDFELGRVPSEFIRMSKTGEHCNYLQGLEGGVDSIHASYLHHNDLSNTNDARRRDKRSRTEVDTNEFGMSYTCIRNYSEDEVHIKFHHYFMPVHVTRGDLIASETPASEFGKPPRIKHVVRGHIWVPIDDENTFIYNYAYKQFPETAQEITDEDWDRDETINGRGPQDYLAPGQHWMIRNLSNDYLINRDVQRTKTFTGIVGIANQDYAVQEGMGAVSPRHLEALGSTDLGVQTVRELLMEATEDVEAGKPPRGSISTSQSKKRGATVIVPKGMSYLDAGKDVCSSLW